MSIGIGGCRVYKAETNGGTFWLFTLIEDPDGKVTEQPSIDDTADTTIDMLLGHWYIKKRHTCAHTDCSCNVDFIGIKTKNSRIMGKGKHSPCRDVGSNDGQAIAQARIIFLPLHHQITKFLYTFRPKHFTDEIFDVLSCMDTSLRQHSVDIFQVEPVKASIIGKTLVVDLAHDIEHFGSRVVCGEQRGNDSAR